MPDDPTTTPQDATPHEATEAPVSEEAPDEAAANDPLTDRDHALVEALAVRVAELLADTPPPAARLLDAAHLAELLGVSRATVYDHARDLGAIRIGDGPRGRLRFDAETALAAWRPREPEPQPRAPRRRAHRAATPLLPIRGERAA